MEYHIAKLLKFSICYAFLKEANASGPVLKKTASAVQHDSQIVTSSSIMSSGSLQVEAIDGKGSNNLKKKHIKYQFKNVYFGPNILLRASLGPHKNRIKKKYHVIKKDCGSNDLGPSTSETRETVAGVQKRRVKSCVKKGVDKRAKREEMNSNGGSLMDAGNNGIKVIEKVKDSKNDSMENGLMSMLTRGLEETLGESALFVCNLSQTGCGMFWNDFIYILTLSN